MKFVLKKDLQLIHKLIEENGPKSKNTDIKILDENINHFDSKTVIDEEDIKEEDI